MNKNDKIKFMYDFYCNGKEVLCNGEVDFIPKSEDGLIGLRKVYPENHSYLELSFPVFIKRNKIIS